MTVKDLKNILNCFRDDCFVRIVPNPYRPAGRPVLAVGRGREKKNRGHINPSNGFVEWSAGDGWTGIKKTA